MNFKHFFKENKFIIIAATFAVIILFIMYLPKNKQQVVSTGDVIEKNIPDYQTTLNTIQAKSFYVYDILENKVIFSKNEHDKLPLASITKLMSGLVVMDVMPDTTIITIGKDDIALEGDNGLLVGEKWKLKDLLDFSLMESSNDGMHAIASALNYYEAVNSEDIVKMMNEKANTLNLKDTVFINETGLDIDKNMSGAYSSAYDVTMLLSNIIKNNSALISSTNKDSKVFVSESNIKHIASNTNTAVNEISGLISSKTGFTDLAGGNLAIVFDAGLMHPVAVVVLGSTVDGRFTDIVKLEQLALEKLSE
jgi:D-alanyl-D-alanine carboxypeptidase (penicillin-binding protein 5/6)